MIDYSIVGKRFGRLVVLGLDHVSGKHNSTWWRCKCDCGNETVVYRGGLTSGDIVSCGCYRKEHIHEYSRKHGLSHDPLYIVWGGMIQRCTNEHADNFQRYGGRGIIVCEDWRKNFENFYNWAISNGYENGLTLDRINNNSGYFPENCRWIDRRAQQNNTRRNRFIEYKGETHTIAEWSRILNINYATLWSKINRGDFKDFEKVSMENSHV